MKPILIFMSSVLVVLILGYLLLQPMPGVTVFPVWGEKS